jgi:diguanylate cyclase (GGDEF)-like protein/PAS domain S-box-containing protein
MSTFNSHLTFLRPILAWFAAPSLPGDDENRHRLRLLNYMVNAGLIFLPALVIINLTDPATPLCNYAIDLVFIAVFFFLRRALRRGQVILVGSGMLTAGFLLITAAIASEGTVRTPVVANLLPVILVAGILFERRGILLSIAACSLAVLGVAFAQTAGLLPSPHETAPLVDWFVLTLTLTLTGGITYFTHHINLEALRRSTTEIQERLRAETEMKKLLQAVEQSPASIVITDLQGKIEYVNPRFCQTTGYLPAEVIGHNPRVLKTDQTPLETHRQLWASLTAGQEWQGEFVNRRKDGSLYHESAVISCIFSPNGAVTHYLAVKEDITERKRIENALKTANEQLNARVAEVEILHAELREQALRDPLTGLHNRRYLSETLPREIARAAREKSCLSIVISDVDHFKMINDTYGHQVGDQFLVLLGQLFKSCLRGSDIVCRYGGEEFVLVLPGVNAAAAEKRAEEIRRKAAGLIVTHAGQPLSVTLSLGVASYPLHGADGEAVIIKADQALYAAKQMGRDQVRVWTEPFSA